MASYLGCPQNWMQCSLCFLWCTISYWTASGETVCETPAHVSLLQSHHHLQRSLPANADHEGEQRARARPSMLEREYHFVPHHKSGTFMTRHAATGMTSALVESGLPAPLIESDPNIMGHAVSPSMLQTARPSCLAHLARNPFEIVVSGHGYHMAEPDIETFLLYSFGQAVKISHDGCEPLFTGGQATFTCKNKEASARRYGQFTKYRSIAQVFRNSISGPLSTWLPDVSLDETYPEYLKRVDLNASLIAEFIFASGESLVPMSFAHNFMQSQPCSLNVCFNEFYDDCNSTWQRVLGAWQIQEPQHSTMLRAAMLACPGVDPSAETHSADAQMKSHNIKQKPEHELVKLLRELDRLVLNGTLAAQELKLGCPVGGKYAEPA